MTDTDKLNKIKKRLHYMGKDLQRAIKGEEENVVKAAVSVLDIMSKALDDIDRILQEGD